MDADLTEGEPGRAERLRRARLRARGDGDRRAGWPWRSDSAARTLFAVGAVCAVLAVVTGRAWWTVCAVLAVLAGCALWAWETGFTADTVRAGRTGRPRRALRPVYSWLTLRSWFARWSWRALNPRDRDVHEPRPRRRRRTEDGGGEREPGEHPS